MVTYSTYTYTRDASWNPTSKILGHEQSQHDPHAARVIAQQYYSTTLVSMPFHAHKEKLGAHLIKVLISFFSTFFELCKSESVSHETAIVWGVCSVSVSICRLVDSSWNVMAHGDAREGKWRGNWRMEWVASTLHTTSEHGASSITTADEHTSAASSRLNWRPRRFKWTRPFRRKTKSGFCACAITFQPAPTTRGATSCLPWAAVEPRSESEDVNRYITPTDQVTEIKPLRLIHWIIAMYEEADQILSRKNHWKRWYCKYSFLNRNIKSWKQLPAGLLAYFLCKLNLLTYLLHGAESFLRS